MVETVPSSQEQHSWNLKTRLVHETHNNSFTRVNHTTLFSHHRTGYSHSYGSQTVQTVLDGHITYNPNLIQYSTFIVFYILLYIQLFSPREQHARGTGSIANDPTGRQKVLGYIIALILLECPKINLLIQKISDEQCIEQKRSIIRKCSLENQLKALITTMQNLTSVMRL